MNKGLDLYGNALIDFYNNQYTEDITVLSPTMENDVMPLPYLFRDYNDMPLLEKKALQLSNGKILDIGAGAGSHSLYLAEKGNQVTALDQSPGAISVITSRLQHTIAIVIEQNIWEHTQKYDTILMLMNGTGIFERLKQVSFCLEHLKKILLSGGQILIDSSDLKFLYEDPEDGGLWIDPSKDYYGEVTFSMKYKNLETPPFEWLYMDYELLSKYATSAGFKIELVQQGDHYDYLARLTL